MKKHLISFLVLLLVVSTVIPISASAKSSQMNRYNVVFVTDASGSMKSTDPEKLRFEAIDLFVGLLANGGNCVGSVVFGNGVVSQTPLREVKNKGDKKVITDDLKNQPVSGWTDIGGGLQAALHMLEDGGDKDIPSIIILLTDGNTEMATTELTSKSISDKEDAMESARQKGIKIFTISLNKNNGANSNEMKQIANATGGEFREVSDASDLQSVFDLYYQLIYSTQSTKLVDEKVPDSGVISRDFSVIDLGVEEVNIVIFGEVNDCKLTKPDGNTVPQAELQDMIYRGNTFTLVKIPDPENGVWNLTVEATPGSTIKIFKIYNANLQVEAEIENKKDSYIKGEPINIVARIKENNSIVTDTSKYHGYQAILKVTDYTDKEVFSQTVDNASADGYHLSFTPDDYGTYYASISVENQELYAETEKLSFNVGNTPPVTVTDVIKKHVNIWPFLIKTDTSIDLSGAAKDAEDATLNYKVKSSTWLEEDYTLSGTKLTIDNFSVSKGSFTIEAYDSLGAYCTFEVQVTSTNIGLVAAILIFGGGLLALALILLFAYRNKIIYRFMGSITLENLETGDSATFEKSRGQIRLSTFPIGNTGFDQRKCYFQATSKNYIKFISNKPFTSDFSTSKTKKIRIDSSIDVRVYSDDSQEKGFSVRFESYLNNSF